jgi:LmbE family N-acetylglucosaminyl deacetylase
MRKNKLTAMVISPHADDAAAFCGATLAKFADKGWHVILVRVTDDRSDSVGLTVEETIAQNTKELHDAAAILGVREIVELGFETDTLADVPLGQLRERIVYLFRKHQPYAVFSFDPFGLYENNQDHVRVAQAVDEAYWVSCFDKHYPEHFAGGLEPFSVCERWYFARQLPKVTHYEEVAKTMERKINAVCAHREMMRNTIHQFQLQLKTWGKQVPWLQETKNGNLKPLIGLFLQEQAKELAQTVGWDTDVCLAEAFRMERFGDLEPLFQTMAEPLENSEPGPEHAEFEMPHPTPHDEKIQAHLIPVDIHERIRLMGHHHLCVGAFDELLKLPVFQLAYSSLMEHLKPHPDLIVETVFGYGFFCYHCGYFSHEEGRCTTGWINKVTKDAAVLDHLGLKPGCQTRIEDLQKILAAKVTYEKLEEFCGPGGEGKCEMYAMGACQKAYADLREKYGFTK